jgi:signal peptidase II
LQEHGVGSAVTSRRRALPVAAVAGAVIAIDQVTKSWAARRLARGDIDLFWTLRLHLARNRDAAFNLGFGSGGIVAILALGVVVVLIVLGRSLDTRAGVVSLGLVLGGALGNLADRAFREGSGFLGGAVVDFIDLQWWPVFNVADSAITVGGIILVVGSLMGSTKARAAG